LISSGCRKEAALSIGRREFALLVERLVDLTAQFFSPLDDLLKLRPAFAIWGHIHCAIEVEGKTSEVWTALNIKWLPQGSRFVYRASGVCAIGRTPG